MSKRLFLINAIIVMVSFSWACGGTPFHQDSTLNKNWGRLQSDSMLVAINKMLQVLQLVHL